MIAVGTTVVRALETVTDDQGVVHPGDGWTELVVTPEHGVRAVDGLLTGWHEPEATHLLMLEAIAGRAALERGLRRGARRAGTCGTSSATATCSSRTAPCDDDRTRPRAARRCPRAGARCSTRCAGAARRRPSEVARPARHDRSGAASTSPRSSTTGSPRPPRCRGRAGQRGRAQLAYTAHRPRPTPVPEGLRRAHQRAARLRRRGGLRAVDDAVRTPARRTHRATRTRGSAPSARLKAKVAELTRILDEDGYLATLRSGRRRACSASSSTTARSGPSPQRYGQACTSEIDFIRTVLPDADGRAGQHMVAGARHCAYEVRAQRSRIQTRHLARCCTTRAVCANVSRAHAPRARLGRGGCARRSRGRCAPVAVGLSDESPTWSDVVEHRSVVVSRFRQPVHRSGRPEPRSVRSRRLLVVHGGDQASVGRSRGSPVRHRVPRQRPRVPDFLAMVAAVAAATPTLIVRFGDHEVPSEDSVSLAHALWFGLWGISASRLVGVFIVATTTVGMRFGAFPRLAVVARCDRRRDSRHHRRIRGTRRLLVPNLADRREPHAPGDETNRRGVGSGGDS